MDKFVGKRLDGRYEIQEKIGVGGMAVVYKAHDNQENRTVAIKILKEEFISNEEFLRRFKNESKAIAMLSHPNIVKVFDVSFGDLIQYIVMEYIEGITLKEFIESQGSLRWKDAVHFTMQILKGLQHAHDKGIVHRDVKPQNIMVLPDGTIKVTDFGIARFARSEQRTITDKAIGSVHYISPEQARGEVTDKKADIYSVGVMLYEMLTGKLPFQAESAVSVAIMQLQREPQRPTELNGSIPTGLEQITMHAMQKNTERRYQSAAEMLCDLSQFRKDPAITFDYSYFVDDSPTKFVGGIDDLGNKSADMEDEADAKEKGNIIPVLAGIAVTLVIAIIVLALLFLPKLFKSTGSEIACPNFIGKTLEEIKNNSEYTANFTFEEEWAVNNDTAYGIVYEQSKNAGQKLKKGAEITLSISMGPSTKKVPDVYGKSESAAVSELKSNGFTVVVTEIANDDVKKGMVIKTDPQRTEVVADGETITVYVSSGSEIVEAEVPDVVGLSKINAQNELKDKKFTAEFGEKYLSETDKYYPKDTVCAQDPTAGSKLSEGSNIIVYLSNGKYKFDLTVILPDDYVNDTGKVSLWYNKQMISEKTVEINSIGKYTFKDVVYEASSASDHEMIITVRLDSEEYKKIKVDCKDGSFTTLKDYSYSKKSDYNTSDTGNGSKSSSKSTASTGSNTGSGANR